MAMHSVEVHLINGELQCTPKEIEVKPGDRVVWQASQPLLVFFQDESPFAEGRGPFENKKFVTVKPKPPLTAGKYVPIMAFGGEVRGSSGDIIVT